MYITFLFGCNNLIVFFSEGGEQFPTSAWEITRAEGIVLSPVTLFYSRGSMGFGRIYTALTQSGTAEMPQIM